jgi:uncharacterized protein YsxB (DUF464 family)
VLKVTFYRDSHDRLSRIFADGHAGWADAGEDIVCAGASAILQSALLGLAEHAGIAVNAGRDAGRLDLRWPEADRGRDDVRAIVETARLAIEHLALQFPDHVQCFWVSPRRT